MDEDTVLGLVGEMVVRGHPVPPPPLVAGPHSHEPLCPLLPPAYQIGQVVHNPILVSGVDVGEERALEGGVGPVFKKLAGRSGCSADCAVAVQRHHGRNGSL